MHQDQSVCRILPSIRHIWASTIPMRIKFRLHVSACYSILVCGSEGRMLNEVTCRCFNGVNTCVLSTTTDKTKYEETITSTTIFDIITWTRDRHPRWVIHITHMDKNSNGEEKQIKETLKVICHNR